MNCHYKDDSIDYPIIFNTLLIIKFCAASYIRSSNYPIGKEICFFFCVAFHHFSEFSLVFFVTIDTKENPWIRISWCSTIFSFGIFNFFFSSINIIQVSFCSSTRNIMEQFQIFSLDWYKYSCRSHLVQQKE